MDQFNEKKRSTQEPETVDEKLQQEVLEKYSKEEAVVAGGGWHGRVTAVLALLMACFHIYTSGTGLLETMMQRSIHLFFVMALAFLMYPGSKKRKRPSIFDVAQIGRAHV